MDSKLKKTETKFMLKVLKRLKKKKDGSLIKIPAKQFSPSDARGAIDY